jgi:hypothetical protein
VDLNHANASLTLGVLSFKSTRQFSTLPLLVASLLADGRVEK